MAKTTTPRNSTRKPAPINPEMGRLQPQARELEEVVLGGLMLEKEAFYVISEILSPECFYDEANQYIYTAIRDLAQQQQPVDMLTVVEKLKANGTIEKAGGYVRIAQLTSRVTSAAHIEYHARIIAQKYLARELIGFTSHIQTKSYDESNDVEELLQEAQGELFKISQKNLKKEYTQVNPVIDEALRNIEIAANRKDGLSGVQTGFHLLDKITSGWQRSDLIVIAARPAMGKTAFVLSMAKNMAIDYDQPTAVFSLEMSNVQLVNRLISNVCEIPSEKIKNGQLSPVEWEQLHYKIKKLYNAPIFVDDSPGLSVFELQTKARQLKAEHNISCVVIDYLQLMNASGMSYGSRQEEVALISRSLKGLAKELNIPVIALSQLNRSVESRGSGDKGGVDGKRPQLSDLRESGAIEQDADMVCFIHRPEYYKIYEDDNGNSLKGLAEIIIAKHRNGSTGDVRLRFRGDLTRFMNVEDDVAPAPQSEYYGSRLNKGGAAMGGADVSQFASSPIDEFTADGAPLDKNEMPF